MNEVVLLVVLRSSNEITCMLGTEKGVAVIELSSHWNFYHLYLAVKQNLDLVVKQTQLWLLIILICCQVLIDFGHLSFANTQALNRKRTTSDGQDAQTEMEGGDFS